MERNLEENGPVPAKSNLHLANGDNECSGVAFHLKYSLAISRNKFSKVRVDWSTEEGGKRGNSL